MSRVEYNKIMDDEKPSPGSIGLLEAPPKRKPGSPLMEVPVSAGGRGNLGSTDRGLDSVADQIVKKAGVNPNAFTEGPKTPEALLDVINQTGAMAETDARNAVVGKDKADAPPPTAGTTLEDIEKRLQNALIALPEAPKPKPVPVSEVFVKGTEGIVLNPEEKPDSELTPEERVYKGMLERQAKLRGLTKQQLNELTLEHVRKNSLTEEEFMQRAGHNPEFSSLQTKEAIREFDIALETGSYKGFKVVREIQHGGSRALVILDPETNQELAVRPDVTDIVDLYYVRDIAPGTAEADQPVAAAKFVNDILLGWEGRTSPISEELSQSLTSTIDQQMNKNVLGQEFVNKLVLQALGRIHLHNGAIKANYAAKELGQELLPFINSGEKNEIFKMPGVSFAIKEMIGNVGGFDEGEYFRLRDYKDNNQVEHNDYKNRKAVIQANIKTYLLQHLPAPQNLTQPQLEALRDAEALRAIDLAEKFMHVYGESAHYDGIRVKQSTNLPGVNLPQDGYVGQKALEVLYPGDNMNLVDRYARFLEDHYDDIDFGDEVSGLGGSLSGKGAAQLKQTFYYPILLQKPFTKNRGDATELRRYAYLWINSGLRYEARTFKPRANMLEAMGLQNQNLNTLDIENFGFDDFGDEIPKMNNWIGVVAAITENRGAFNDKGEESVLNTPVPDANRVTNENMHETVPKALENIRKSAAIYSILSPEQKLRANLHLFKGVMQWMKSPEARGPDFQILGWNTNQYRLAVDTLIEHDFLERRHGRDIMADIQGLLWNIAAIAENGFREGSEDFWATLFALTRFFKYD